MTYASNIAKALARCWYERPESGCDESTLAYMVENALVDAQKQARTEERQRIAAKIADLVGAGDS